MPTINMREVGGVFEPEHLDDPFSEYVHKSEAPVQHTTNVVRVEETPQTTPTRSKEELFENVDRMFEGANLVFDLANHVFKHLRRR